MTANGETGVETMTDERYRYGSVIAEVRPAEGVAGVLCRLATGGYVFRVYEKDHGFTDYDLRHDSLEVTISPSAMASFYAIGADRLLDHSPQVLGLMAAPPHADPSPVSEPK